MKIDLFENKYNPSNVSKILFFDIICFLLVVSITLGICYAYFSDSVSASGASATANVAVEYQYNKGGGYVASDEVYVFLNDYDKDDVPQSLSGMNLTPGDKITIVGQVASLSDVSVYVLAKLEIQTIQKGESVTEIVWFNVGSNDPQINPDTKEEIVSAEHTSNALAEDGYKQLTTKSLTGTYGTHDVFQVGAGSLGAHKTKQLAIPYTFGGEKYENGDEIINVKLTLHVHQKDHLTSASDFYLYKQFEDGVNTINGYDTTSIYAAHYMVGNALKANNS